MSMRLGTVLVAAALAACETVVPVHRMEPASFKLEVICAGADAAECPAVAPGAAECPAATTPANLGDPASPVDRTQRFYVAQVTAIGSNGQPATDYAATANVYVMFDGSVSPSRDALTPPLATLPFTGGRACLAVKIPPAFNKTALWVEDSGPTRAKGSFAVGVGKAIYRPSPVIADIQETDDKDYTLSPLNTKHVLVEDGTDGQPLIVTGVYAQGFMVTDLGQGGVDHAWGSLYVYSYGQPTGVKVGMRARNLNGTLGEFNGLTELNFPIWDIDDAAGVHPELVPEAHEIKQADLVKTLDAMEPYESALVQVKEWFVCALPAGGRDRGAFDKYGQWKLAPKLSASGECTDSKSSMSVVSQSTVPSFNPLEHEKAKVCVAKGALSHVVPAKGVNLWMLNPRDASDLVVAAADGSCP